MGLVFRPSISTALQTPFFQVERALHHNDHGVGLGLAITKHFVALHGGTLDFESRSGLGTVAFVCAPGTRVMLRETAEPAVSAIARRDSEENCCS